MKTDPPQQTMNFITGTMSIPPITVGKELVPYVFDYGKHEIDLLEREGVLWFVLQSVCNAVGLGSPHKVAERLDPEEVDKVPYSQVNPSRKTFSVGKGGIPTPRQPVLVITEPGLYDVLLRSNKPEARKFSKWVRSEVLPSIRKHGGYGHTPAPKLSADQFTGAFGNLVHSMIETTSKLSLMQKQQIPQIVQAHQTLGEQIEALDWELSKTINIWSDRINQFEHATGVADKSEKCSRATLCDLLVNYQKRTGHSHTEMERISGISQTTLRLLTQPGRRNIMPATMVKLTRFGFPLDVIKAAAIQTASDTIKQ